jgi:hypothetical protein
VNAVLEEAGLEERIDHRSYADQGLDFLEPTVHEGHEVTALRRDGIDTEISLKNDVIKAKNLDAAREYQQVIKGLDQEILVPDYFAEKISVLENELHLTEAEERALLAEFANIEQEEKYIQEQTAQIDNAYVNFIELQPRYAEFANRFYEVGTIVNKKIEALEKNIVKSEKWLSKQTGFYQSNGLFYDNYHHQATKVDTPFYFTTRFQVAEDKEKLMKQYRTDIAKLSESCDVENIVKKLHQNAEKLTENGIELPVSAPTFMQKIMGEYIHSYDTLSDFNAHMKPVIDEHREETEYAEQEQLRAYYAEKKREELEQKREAENRRRKTEYDLEVEKRIDAQKRQERMWANEPKSDKKQSKDNDNDFTPSK